MPQVALVLGSGLGDFAQKVETVCSIDYSEIEGFPFQPWQVIEAALSSVILKACQSLLCRAVFISMRAIQWRRSLCCKAHGYARRKGSNAY